MAGRVGKKITVQGGPFEDLAQRARVEPVDAVPALLPDAHQPSASQNAQVLRDRRLRNRKRSGQIVHRALFCAKLVEEPAAGRVGNGAEDVMDLGGGHSPESTISDRLYVKS